MESSKRKRVCKEIIAINKQPAVELPQAPELAEGIVATVHTSLLVLDASLRIVWANSPFYKLFSAKRQETEGRLIYEIGDKRWDIPKLRELLQRLVRRNTSFGDFEVEYDSPQVGRRTMILNARGIQDGGSKTARVLLAIEDITERRRVEIEKAASELRYRRLFETAQDGILILDAETGQIADVNPFLMDMLGYSKDELLGKRLWILAFS